MNWGVGVLLAGGWVIPAAAAEVLPEPVVADTDQAQLLSNVSRAEMGAIASPIKPTQVLPEQFPPSVTPINNAVASLTAASEVTAHPQLSETAIESGMSDRFEPEFAQETFQPPPVQELAQGELNAQEDETVIVETDSTVQEVEGSVISAEGDLEEPLDEEASQLDQAAETVLDNTEVPAGDLLESVDGLEDSGIAGEGAATEEPIPASDEAAAEDAVEGDPQPDSSLDNGEAEAGEELESDSEEFDSEEFEAEDFEFEEDEAEAVPDSPDSTVENESEGDPDLGVLRVRERPLAKQKPPLKIPVFLVGNVGYIANGNTLAGVDPVNDRLFRSGISLITSPRLSKRTALIASVQGNINRYNELSRLDYNEVRLQASLRHVLTRKVYGDLGWTHRQLFLQEDGDRFLYEHAAFTSLTRRDPLTKKTNLTSFYNLRLSFAEPETSSRLRNTLGVSLRHNVTPALQASLTGRMTLTNFTQQSRQDFYTQALAQLSYKMTKNVRLSLFGSLAKGNSSNRRVDFDNSTLGVRLSGNVKLF